MADNKDVKMEQAYCTSCMWSGLEDPLCISCPECGCYITFVSDVGEPANTISAEDCK